MAAESEEVIYARRSSLQEQFIGMHSFRDWHLSQFLKVEDPLLYFDIIQAQLRAAGAFLCFNHP